MSYLNAVFYFAFSTLKPGANRALSQVLVGRTKMAVMDKIDEFYRPQSGPISGSVSRPKRAKISVIEQGYRRVVTDPKLSVSLRIKALDQLARFNPPERFLARLVRKADTPGRLRLAATQLLDKIRTADKATRGPTRAQAERTAKELLERIRGQQAQPASDTTLSEGKKAEAEAVSVFDGLD
jgi:hypothetical protein